MKTRKAAITLVAAGLLAVGGVGLAGCGGSDVTDVVSEGVGGAESVGEDIATGAVEGSEDVATGVESVGESIGESADDLADDVADGAKDGAEAND